MNNKLIFKNDEKNIINFNNQKGITLIALVITIIVLLILAGISISMLSGENGILEQARSATMKTEQGEITDKLKLAAADAMLKGDDYISIESKGNLYDALKAQGVEVKEEDVDGDKTEGYTVTIDDKVYKITSSGKLTLPGETQNTITFSKTVETLSIGDEVTASNGELFYVIGGDEAGTEISETTQKVLLLAKTNLLKDHNGNDISVIAPDGVTEIKGWCEFSSTNYWSSVEGIAYPYANGKYPDLNDVDTYQIGEATSIAELAKLYGSSLGTIGRLMTIEEVKALGADVENKTTEACPDFINDQIFYLGSAASSTKLWGVLGQIKFLEHINYNTNVSYGFRPVIEVSLDLIK